MGRPPRCNRTPPNSKPELFDQAERVAFVHVGQALRDMAFCSIADLEQAAFSYLWQSIHNSGAAHLFGEAYTRRKAATWAAWWFRKHRDRRKPRPHSQYSAAQAARGRQVALIRKRGRADWMGLQVQLMRWQGGKVAQIAGRFGCSERSVFRLSKRRFPKLVLAILGQALHLTHGKSSCLATSDIEAIGRKELLPCGRFDQEDGAGRPAGDGIDGASGQVERIGAAIPDILRELWAAQPL